MGQIAVRNSYFIKLGAEGDWESDCLKSGTIRLGYRETPADLCQAGQWDLVRKFWQDFCKNLGVGTRHANQIRIFYEANESDLFITFANNLLYWCKPSGAVRICPDGSKERGTLDGWQSHSVGGKRLTSDRLSGGLLKVQMFRGTICKVTADQYLIQKINDETSPEVTKAETALAELSNALTALIRRLSWQDFELLVDLVFSASGWRRIGETGKTQKTVDLELSLPTTGERAFVQVKSSTDAAALKDYANRFEKAEQYGRMFFVWHTGKLDEIENDTRVTLIGPESLSRLVIDAGLASWLIEKTS